MNEVWSHEAACVSKHREPLVTPVVERRLCEQKGAACETSGRATCVSSWELLVRPVGEPLV